MYDGDSTSNTQTTVEAEMAKLVLDETFNPELLKGVKWHLLKRGGKTMHFALCLQA